MKLSKTASLLALIALSLVVGCVDDPKTDLPVCGDGVVEEPAEECDDGNTAGGDGCRGNCTE